MQFFIAWIVIALIWLWFTLVVAIFYPIIDGGILDSAQEAKVILEESQ
jgi:hypothetical protein